MMASSRKVMYPGKVLMNNETFMGMHPSFRNVYRTTVDLLDSHDANMTGVIQIPLRKFFFHLNESEKGGKDILSAFLNQYPNLLAYDESTSEIAVVNWPNLVAGDFNARQKQYLATDLKKVRSPELLKKMCKANHRSKTELYVKALQVIAAENTNEKLKLRVVKTKSGVPTQVAGKQVVSTNTNTNTNTTVHTPPSGAGICVGNVAIFGTGNGEEKTYPILGKALSEVQYKKLIATIGKKQSESLLRYCKKPSNINRVNELAKDKKKTTLFLGWLIYRWDKNKTAGSALITTQVGITLNIKPFIKYPYDTLSKAITTAKTKGWTGFVEHLEYLVSKGAAPINNQEAAMAKALKPQFQ